MNDFLYCMLLLGVMVFFVSCKIEEKEYDKVNFKEVAPCRYLYKIEYEDHTYIYLRNTWNSAGDKFLHDPSCKCLKKDTSENE